MRSLFLSCLLLSPCFHLPHLLYGQEGQAPLQPGDRIRIYAPSEYQDRVVGSIWSMERDTIVVKNESNATWRIPNAAITRLEFSQGRRSGSAGALRGLLIGGGAGTLVGLAAVVAACTSDDAGLIDPCGYAPAAFVVATFVGALTGMTVGALSPGERWEEVPLDQLRVSIVPQRDGRLGFGLAVTF